MGIRRWLWLSILAWPLLSAATLRAHPVDPGPYSGLNWRLIGPFRRGRVTAVTNFFRRKLRERYR